MFQPSVNQISSAYLGNPGALQAKVQQEQKGNPGLPPDLRDLLALQDIQTQKDAYARQMAMTPPQPTVADQLIQAVKQPLPEPGQAMPQGMPQGMPQQGMPQQGMPQQGMPQQGMPTGMPQGLPQGLPQGMAASMPPAPQPGLQQLPSNIGQHMSGGGIVAFADGENVQATDDPLRDYVSSLSAARSLRPEEKIIQEAMSQDPAQAKAAAIRDYQKEVGSRDTSQYDRLIAEYENRKKQLEGPKPGIDALMEYLGQIAAAPRGKTWMESGSMAARAQNDLNAQRQAQQFELTKLGIDAAQKKADIAFGEKKDLFGMGRAAYDQAYKANYEAALKVTGNAFEAEKLAKQMTDNEMNRTSREKIEELGRTSREKIEELGRISAEKMAKERNVTSMATANAPGQSERETNRIMALIQKGTPESLAEAKQRQEIYGSITGSGAAGVGAAKNLTRQLQMSISGYEKEINPLTNPTGTPEEREEAKVKLAAARQRLEMLSGLIKEEEGGIPSISGKAPPPPPGFVKQ